MAARRIMAATLGVSMLAACDPLPQPLYSETTPPPAYRAQPGGVRVDNEGFQLDPEGYRIDKSGARIGVIDVPAKTAGDNSNAVAGYYISNIGADAPGRVASPSEGAGAGVGMGPGAMNVPTVGLSSAHAERYPHEFSGGQRQRVCIARALASDPKLIIADEALSALDVSIQAQIINLFMDLQAERGLSYLFISHDMAVVEKISHRVAVLYLGQIMEMGSRRQVFETPMHDYTRRLLSAIPVADPTARRETAMIEGEIPNPVRRVGDEPAILVHEEIRSGHFVAKSA